MHNAKCAFKNPLLSGAFGCARAEPVSTRDGPDILCRSEEASERCRDVFERMKRSALPVFDVEDDLLQMPHSALVKIQYGGLLGLREALGADPADGRPVENIDALVEQESRDPIGPAAPAWNGIVEHITTYRIKRQRSRSR